MRLMVQKNPSIESQWQIMVITVLPNTLSGLIPKSNKIIIKSIGMTTNPMSYQSSHLLALVSS